VSVVEKCSKCDAHCCRHVAVQIGKPVTKKEIDQVRWYLLHENVWVSIDHEGDWLLEFRTPCRKIVNNQCGDYENRPAICRDYPGENEYCERETDETSYAVLFTNEEEFVLYLNKLDHKKTTLQTRMKKAKVNRRVQRNRYV
jgi:uncharacterized protein